MRSKRGVIAGAFDIIHPGYIYAFREAKIYCEKLIVFLHDDPNSERSGKLKPILSLNERVEILKSIVYVDDIFPYDTETDLHAILSEIDYDIRFLGSDYLTKPYTHGKEGEEIHYLGREHGWSETKLIKLIIERGLPKS